jgi:hypothetical protein
VGVGVCGGVGVWGLGVFSPCARTFQGLHSVRLWTPTIYFMAFYKAPKPKLFQDFHLLAIF